MEELRAKADLEARQARSSQEELAGFDALRQRILEAKGKAAELRGHLAAARTQARTAIDQVLTLRGILRDPLHFANPLGASAPRHSIHSSTPQRLSHRAVSL